MAVVLNFQKKPVVRLFDICFACYNIVRPIFIAVLLRKFAKTERIVHNCRIVIYIVSAVCGECFLLPLCVQYHIAHIEIQYPVGIRLCIGRIEIPARKDVPHPCRYGQRRHILRRVRHVGDGRVCILRYK